MEVQFKVYKCSGCNVVSTKQSYVDAHLKRETPCKGKHEPIQIDASYKDASMPVVEKYYKIYECSRCGLWNSSKHYVEIHLKRETQCKDTAHIVESILVKKMLAKTMLDKKEILDETRKTQLEIRLGTVLPAGLCDLEDEDTRGIDDRTDYVCANPQVLEFCLGQSPKCHATRAIDISLKLLSHLWGAKAPEEFRAIYYRSNAVHVLRHVDCETDPPHADVASYRSGDEIQELITNIYLVLGELAIAISRRCKGVYADKALAYAQLLRGTGTMTTLDVLDRTETYTLCRKQEPGRVKFANNFKSAVRAFLLKTKGPSGSDSRP